MTGTVVYRGGIAVHAPASPRARGALLLWPVLLLALLPVVYLIVSSFNVADFGSPYAFGLDNWAAAISAGTGRAILNTLLLSTRVFFAFIVAVAISWSLVRIQIPGRRFVEISLWFAFFLPPVPIAMAWILLLHKDYGLVNIALGSIPFMPRHLFSIHSIPGIMWIYLTISTAPFLTIVFTPAFRRLDATFEEAARVNGARRLQALIRIVLPILLPALLIGLTATFVRSMESFEVEQLVGAPARIYVFTTRIYDLIHQDPPLFGQAMALGTLFLIVVIVLAAAQMVYARRHPTAVTVRSHSFRSGISHRRRLRIFASIAIIAYVVVSIYLPVAVMIMGSCNKIFGFFQMPHPWTFAHWQEVLTDDRFLRALRNSMFFGVGVSVVVLPLYMRLAWILARSQAAGRRIATLLLWLPWAVPGFIFGLALLDILTRVKVLSPFYGTFAPIVFALVIKEMPIGVQLLKVAIEQTGKELEDAARVAGARGWHVFARITLPLLSPTAVAVFIIVFAAVIKEISTIVLVAGPGTQTLSLLMFDYATTGRSESAAVVGVIFAVASLVLAAIISRHTVEIGAQ